MACRHDTRPCLLCRELADFKPKTKMKQSFKQASENFILKRPEKFHGFLKSSRQSKFWSFGQRSFNRSYSISGSYRTTGSTLEARRRCTDSLNNVVLPSENTPPELTGVTSVSLDNLSYHEGGFENMSFDCGSLESIFLGGSATPVGSGSPKPPRIFSLEDLRMRYEWPLKKSKKINQN
ncbi:uncharacterized protein LOC117642378 [Thrips palmi]|uniref:Uncharacterized protein LOC117642378 n=1 Tax=Thrips palmi TaxID=161013 RepID=A0A6P8YQJ4_THRPL|nr:uncharacterized protein LOC117642378 [Thrips palmi]